MKELHQRVGSNDWVVICAIIYEQFEQGQSNYENYTILPSHCEEDKYTKCPLWRETKEKDWARNMQKYSSLDQAERISI